MKKNLSRSELILIGSMLFGMFFGAGNLIFPIHLGQLAGKNIILALSGFLITGVGLPILGVAAIGVSHSNGLKDASSKISKKYGIFFTSLLYLTIGPLFAIPRCATASYTIGFSTISSNKLGLFIFSMIFFMVALFFSLKPSKIMVWIGKYLNPIFLALFSILIVMALLDPIASVFSIVPDVSYSSNSLLKGFLEGYNTMDALAGLAFGIIVVDSIKQLGIENEKDIAKNTLKAGLFCALLMSAIYLGACIIGTQSRGMFEISENGGIALTQITNYYLGDTGQLFLALLVIFACLKTAIGLITSISKTFSEMFTHGKYYKTWTIIFTLFSFLISNVGLDQLINLSVPVLEFIYPLAIVLIFLNLFGFLFQDNHKLYISVIFFTMIASILDLLKGFNILIFDSIANQYLPFYSAGFGWITLSFIGIIFGIFWMKKKKGSKL